MAESIKKFDTRILLKYDSLARWNESELVLKAGEVAIATVPTTESTTVQSGVITPPAAVIMKVGDGEKTFSQLPIVSALAADVHGWAKKDEAQIIEWLDATFATDAALEALDSRLSKADQDLADLIDTITGGSGDVEGLGALSMRIGDLEKVLQTYMVKGEDGAVTADAVKAAIDAVAGSVTTLAGRVSTAEGEIETIKSARTELSGVVSGISGKVTTLEEKMETAEGEIEALSAKVGSIPEGSDLATMVGAVEEAAKEYVDEEIATVSGSVTELSNLVSGHTETLATITGSGEGSIKAEVASGIASVVASAPEDFNTLKEIADWIASDKEGSATLQATVSQHTESIAGLLAEDAVIKKSISDLDAELQGQIDVITDSKTGILAVLEPRVKANEDAIALLQAADKTTGEAIAALQAKDTELAGLIAGHTTSIAELVTNLGAEVTRATGAEASLLQAIEDEAARASAAEQANATAISTLDAAVKALHKVASTGSINDLGQTEEIFFDCGNSAERVYNA